MPDCGLYSIEGNTTSEPGGLVGDATLDDADPIVGGFNAETGAVYIGGGAKSIVQRVFVEADTEGQTVTCILHLDETEYTLGTFSTAIGVKDTAEFSVNRTGRIASVRLSCASVTKRIEITSIELDVYNPDDVGQ
jgi:hypothetical protein